MNQRTIFFCSSIIIAATIFICGCENPKEATVSGIVTLDGNLLDCGSVTFLAGSNTEGKAAAGGIGTDGSYHVQIGQSGKMWSGEYVVKVSAREPSTPHPDGGPPIAGALITPERYLDPSTSGLRYNIRPGENVIDITLVSEDPEASSIEAASSETTSSETLDLTENAESKETDATEPTTTDAQN